MKPPVLENRMVSDQVSQRYRSGRSHRQRRVSWNVVRRMLWVVVGSVVRDQLCE